MNNIDFKNLWVNLTVVLPGMVTYATWRIVIMLMGYKGIDFKTIDGSAVLSVCVVFAIAIIQQAAGISLEAMLAWFFHLFKDKWKNAHKLFVGRFRALVADKYNEPVMRTIGQFFLSLNVCVGQVMILVFIIVAQNPISLAPVEKLGWLLWLSVSIVIITMFVAIFRCWNAIEAIEEAEKIAEKNAEVAVNNEKAA